MTRWEALKPLTCNLWPLCFSCFRADGKTQLTPCWAGMTSSEFYNQPYWFAHYLLNRRPSCRSIILFHFILLYSEYTQHHLIWMHHFRKSNTLPWPSELVGWCSCVCLCEFISAFANAAQRPVLPFTSVCKMLSNQQWKAQTFFSFDFSHKAFLRLFKSSEFKGIQFNPGFKLVNRTGTVLLCHKLDIRTCWYLRTCRWLLTLWPTHGSTQSPTLQLITRVS